jgi:hypothetical protein
MRRAVCLCTVLALATAASLAAADAPASKLALHFPLNRKAYQTNERIEVSVVRSGAAALPAEELTLRLTGEDQSKLEFHFDAPAAELDGKEARRTEHFYLNGWLLRPGNYTLEVATAGGTPVQAPIEIYSHLRKSSFRLGDWGSRADSKKGEQAVMGEEGMGFNLLYPAYGGLNPDDTIRGGVDYMWNCTMSGAHQMDIRMECDWSDPVVLGGGTARVVRRALQDRVNPNAVGVHFYDEPGLTWHKHPGTGEMTPHNIPAQDRAYKAAFGKDMKQYDKVDPKNADDVRTWQQWGRWKEAFMEAAWKHAAHGVREVRSDMIPATQSVYGWNAFTDGYYFNVVRSLPVMSGHGGYDDFGGGYFNPSYTFEFGRMRDLNKPNWYLPAWYQGMPSDRFRLEQYLSFMGNLQGMFKPPDQTVHRPSTCPTSDGIVESNKLMGRLGTIFTTMPPTRPEVAILYSLSQCLDAQSKDMKDNYTGGKHGREKTLLPYIAGKMTHVTLFPIVEEDVVDGTLAAHHKAVLLPGINYLEPKVIAALESYIEGGGHVLVSDESQVKIKGATPLGIAIDTTHFDRIGKLWEAKNFEELSKVNTTGALFKSAAPLAKKLEEHYKKLGIKPEFDCDNAEVAVARQASGDIEYLFAVNASFDDGVNGMNSIKPATATLKLPGDGRPVYDAILGGAAEEFKGDKVLSAAVRFGPGQMRAYARTARPIGGVQALTPVVVKDYTLAQEPVRVEVAAALADSKGKILAGSAPLQIRLIDPLGGVRYDLHRATERGSLKLNLPLAVNDPAGTWKVVIRELLNNTEDTATFTYTPPAQCNAAAGAARRALAFGNDRDNIYRMFRNSKDVTVVIGTAAYHEAAAKRVAEVLKPWGVTCKTVKAADVKPRSVSIELAHAWCGLEPGRVRPELPADLAEIHKSGQFLAKFDRNNDGFLTREEMPKALEPFFDRYDQNNDKKLDKNEIAQMTKPNAPQQVGYDLPGSAILVGTPQDNVIVGYLEKAKFLPYVTTALDFPGKGRGLLAWQRDGVGHDRESATLIAYDEKGMGEAVGSLYEAVAGLDPLTPWQPARKNKIVAATKAPTSEPKFHLVWKKVLPDRAVDIRTLPGGQTAVLTEDGTLSVVDAQGKLVWAKEIKGGENWALDVAADGSVIAVGATQHIVAFDAKGTQLFDVPTTDDARAGAVTFVAVTADGSKVAAGATNGKLTVIDKAGERAWTVGGVDPNVKNARPNPYFSGAFGSDAKTLLALMANEGHVVGISDGKVGAKIGGLKGHIAPQRVGSELLVSDGRSAQLVAADGKVIKKINLPDVGVVSVALVGDDVVIGGESAGAVRRLKAVTDSAPNAAIWESKDIRRAVKKIATKKDGTTAISYWGGLVRVVDATGAVKAAHPFQQDTTALTWNGDTLIVGLANGKVEGLAVK